MAHILLLSRDPQLTSTIQAACTKLSMDMTVCPDTKHAAALLKKRKFYAAVVDSTDVEGTSEFLVSLRQSPSSKTAISILFADAPARGVPDAAMVVAKPVSAELALRTLRAAKGSITKELQRYLRHPLRTAVTLTLASKRDVHATSVNISDGGLEVVLFDPEVLSSDSPVRARFVLPESGSWVQVNGEVVWCDGNRVGLRFRAVSPGDSDRLRNWFSTRAVKIH